jgi:small-conductance mechanosensitive channel
MEAQDTARAATTEVQNDLPALKQDIDAREEDTKQAATPEAPLDALRDLQGRWQSIQGQLAGWMQKLTAGAARADADLAQLPALRTEWNATLNLAHHSSAPPEINREIQGVLDQIGKTGDALRKSRQNILTLQSAVAEQKQRTDAALQTINSAQAAAVNTLWMQDSPPIWSRDLLTGARADFLANGHASMGAQAAQLRTFIARDWTNLVYFALILCAVAYSFVRALPKVRQRTEGWLDEDPSLDRAQQILQRPYITGCVLAFLGSPVLFPGAPRLFWAVLAVVALVPITILLRHLIDRHLYPFLNAVILFYLLNHARALTSGIPVLARALLLLQSAAGVLFALWFVRSTRSFDGNAPSARMARLAARLAIPLFAVVFITNCLGYVALASLLGTATVTAGYLAILFYAAANIVKSFLYFALQLWPLASLELVRRHRPLLRRRIGQVISVAAAVLWALAAMEAFAIRKPVIAGAVAVLGAKRTIGSLELSLGGVLAFGITIWLSVMVSRFIRFVLQEDIYGRVGLARGSSYAVSTISHYVILLCGFLLALTTIGVDMTKLTILAGAFGVGVGFGLQNIFNNFFSGIILLLERPIHIGDLIDVSGGSGVVMEIGIRASRIRLADNSVLIVPNAQLISNNVTNHDAPSSQAQITLPVRVAYGSDAKRVIATLKQVAGAGPQIARTPEPQVLVADFSADALLFNLICSTDDPGHADQIKSELAIAALEALAAAGVQFPAPRLP